MWGIQNMWGPRRQCGRCWCWRRSVRRTLCGGCASHQQWLVGIGGDGPTRFPAAFPIPWHRGDIPLGGRVTKSFPFLI